VIATGREAREAAGDGLAVDMADRLPTATAAEAPAHQYTLHVDFTADDADKALTVAAALTDGLAVLRPEVDAYTARLSMPGASDNPRPLFCGANGPKGAVCGDFNGHAGWHIEAGVHGLRWGEGDEDGTRG
jgi:hypothetical protein